MFVSEKRGSRFSTKPSRNVSNVLEGTPKSIVGSVTVTMALAGILGYSNIPVYPSSQQFHLLATSQRLGLDALLFTPKYMFSTMRRRRSRISSILLSFKAEYGIWGSRFSHNSLC